MVKHCRGIDVDRNDNVVISFTSGGELGCKDKPDKSRITTPYSQPSTQLISADQRAANKELLRKEDLKNQFEIWLKYTIDALNKLSAKKGPFSNTYEDGTVNNEVEINKKGAQGRMKGYISTIENDTNLGFSDQKAELYVAAQKFLLKTESNSPSALDPLKNPEHPLRKNTLTWLDTSEEKEAHEIQISIERFLTLSKILFGMSQARHINSTDLTAVIKTIVMPDLKTIASRLKQLNQLSPDLINEVERYCKFILAKNK